jgi:Domain of unknown function (DUF5615)
MKIHYQADADLNEDIVNGVLRRVPEINFKTASEAKLAKLTDMEVLTIAGREKRLLVTHDRRTMPKHFAEFIKTNKSLGVIVISQKADIASVIDDLILIWHISEAEEFINSIRALPL